MAPPIVQLRDLIHLIACRAIRHDLKTPLAHVESFCGLLKQTLHRKPEILLNKIARPLEVAQSVIEIPMLAQAIRSEVIGLERSLNSSVQYSGGDAKKSLKELIDGKSADLESKATSLRDAFEGVDQQGSEYATRLAKNAKAARSRLRSLLAFFKAEYANRPVNSLNLREQAERAARDTSLSSALFLRVFRFAGSADIFGTESLVQNLFQNIYENTIRYGAGTPNLSSLTRFTVGTFSDLAGDISAIKERPPPSASWVRIDCWNNGPPITAVDANSVFQLGKRFRVAGIVDDEGQGIGMAICFAVATLHKGFIWAFKRQEGVLFSVFLPRRSEDGFNDAQLLSIAKMMRIV